MSEPCPQPPLPAQIKWPQRTREWWDTWGASDLSTEFTATDWNELLDAALLHARFWAGDTKVAGELRTRLAKFGSTPVDRARLKRLKTGKPPKIPKGMIKVGVADDGLPIYM